jgi:lipoate-protein ligase A
MSFRFINTNSSSATLNMAIDEALIALYQKPTLRFYTWNKPTISLGYFQKALKHINVDYCNGNKINIVRRLTGGRSVLHFNELTYSLCMPTNSNYFKETVNSSYQFISTALIKGLSKLSIHASFSPEKTLTKSQFKSGACFDAPSNYEITVEGKKIIGSAQTRKKNILLQHGSILNESNLDLLVNCLNFNSENAKDKFLSLMHQKSISIEDILGNPLSYESQVDAFLDGFKNVFQTNFELDNLTETELSLAYELEQKYIDQSWTFKR